MSAFKYFTKIDILKHVKASEGLTVRVQRQQPGAKTTEVEAHGHGNLILVCASTDDGRPLTGGTNLIWTVVDWGRANLAHDFSVKLSPCMCSHVSCLGRRNGWRM